MDVKELKNKIESKTLDDNFMVWVEKDDSSSIISNQYLDKIAKFKNMNIKSIDSIADIPDSSFIDDDNLYVIKVDKWDDSRKHNNCIVVCRSTNMENIKLPSLEEWQIIDYLVPMLDGLDKSDIELLVSLYKSNYIALLNDVDKIKIFTTSEHKFMLNKLLEDELLNVKNDVTIWDLSNAIIHKDCATISKILDILNTTDIEPLGLLSVLYTNFKNIISIQLDPMCTAEQLGITDKQLFVIKKYNCGIYKNDRLVSILRMLTELEYKFKFEGLPLEHLIDYMICKIL